MKNKNYCIHLQRRWINSPKEFPNAEYQRFTYELIKPSRVTLQEIHMILKHFSIMSNGEFKYWITDEFKIGEWPHLGYTTDVIYSTDLDIKQNEEHTENICALHSGESETNTKGSAE